MNDRNVIRIEKLRRTAGRGISSSAFVPNGSKMACDIRGYGPSQAMPWQGHGQPLAHSMADREWTVSNAGAQAAPNVRLGRTIRTCRLFAYVAIDAVKVIGCR